MLSEFFDVEWLLAEVITDVVFIVRIEDEGQQLCEGVYETLSGVVVTADSLIKKCQKHNGLRVSEFGTEEKDYVISVNDTY